MIKLTLDNDVNKGFPSLDSNDTVLLVTKSPTAKGLILKDLDNKLPEIFIHGGHLIELYADWRKFLFLISRRKFVDKDLITSERRSPVIEFLGCSPKTLHKVFRALVSTLLIDPIKHLNINLCTFTYLNGKRILSYNFKLIFDLHKMKSEIEQLQKDNIMNLWPFVVRFEKCPQQLKTIFGKSTWKQIAANSMSRNMLLINASDFSYSPYSIPELLAVPSTLLKNSNTICSCITRFDFFTSENIVKLCKILKTSKIRLKDPRVEHIITLFVDTLRMGLSFNSEYKIKAKTVEDINRIHDKLTQKQLEKKLSTLSTEKYLNVENLEFTIDEWKFTLLNCEKDYYIEGKKMHHCIYSYAPRAENNEYITFHVVDTINNEESTLGYRYRDYGPTLSHLVIDQQKGVSNRSVVTLSKSTHAKLIEKLRELPTTVFKKVSVLQ